MRVISTPGQLTDHYNPVEKQFKWVSVYNQRIAAAVAARVWSCGTARSRISMVNVLN
jgi:Zn-dependent membrane protease YugP